MGEYSVMINKDDEKFKEQTKDAEDEAQNPSSGANVSDDRSK